MASSPLVLANDLAGHLRNWLSRQGYRTAPANLYAAEGFEGESADAAAVYNGEGITFGPSRRAALESLAGRYGKRGRMSYEENLALEGLVHELVHSRMGDGYNAWYDAASPATIDREETSTYQAVDDLMPALRKQLFGHGGPVEPKPGQMVFSPPYLEERRDYRQRSVFGSGSRRHQDRQARLWRRTYANADETTRDAMDAQALRARLAWGKRTGR